MSSHVLTERDEQLRELHYLMSISSNVEKLLVDPHAGTRPENVGHGAENVNADLEQWISHYDLEKYVDLVRVVLVAIIYESSSS